MTIYKLRREKTADLIIRRLPTLWDHINRIVGHLRDIDRTYSTIQLINTRTSFINTYNLMNNFNATHNAWFITRYPDFATALPGAITSLQNINNAIMNGLQANYWDAELDAPVLIDIAQNHRNVLADSIESELES